MILPVRFFWEQLDGPQVNALMDAIYEYFKSMFDDKLDYLNTLNIESANDSHLTFLGMLANFTRPIITVPDKDFFFLTEDVETGSDHGFASLDNRLVGGRLTGIEGATTEARALNTEHYRALLRAFIQGDGEIGSLQLLDDICYELTKLDLPNTTPFYRFEFMEGDDIPEGRAPGDVYVDIGTLDDWSNPMHIYAVLRGLAKSSYWPVPQLFISIDTQVTVPAPVSSLPSGSYQGPQNIELSCDMKKAIIYYTLDNSTPTTESSVYIPYEAITISRDTTLKVRAIAPNYNNSPVVTYSYVII